jgi:hypothetical protein
MEIPILIVAGAASLALVAILLPASETSRLPMPDERPGLEETLRREIVSGRRAEAEHLYRQLNGVDARTAERAIARQIPRC